MPASCARAGLAGASSYVAHLHRGEAFLRSGCWTHRTIPLGFYIAKYTASDVSGAATADDLRERKDLHSSPTSRFRFHFVFLLCFSSPSIYSGSGKITVWFFQDVGSRIQEAVSQSQPGKHRSVYPAPIAAGCCHFRNAAHRRPAAALLPYCTAGCIYKCCKGRANSTFPPKYF